MTTHSAPCSPATARVTLRHLSPLVDSMQAVGGSQSKRKNALERAISCASLLTELARAMTRNAPLYGITLDAVAMGALASCANDALTQSDCAATGDLAKTVGALLAHVDDGALKHIVAERALELCEVCIYICMYVCMYVCMLLIWAREPEVSVAFDHTGRVHGCPIVLFVFVC